MSRMKEERLFNKVKKLSKKWWFYLILLYCNITTVMSRSLH